MVPRLLEQSDIGIDVSDDGSLGLDGVLALLGDLLIRLLSFLNQVHLEEIVLLQLLEVVSQVFLTNLDRLLVIGIISVQIDVRVFEFPTAHTNTIISD